MSDLVYAAVGKNSPYAGAIGWVDFNGITLRAGNSITGMEAVAKDGTIISFDLSCVLVSGTQGTFKGTVPPVFSGAAFGRTGYMLINRPVVLYNSGGNISGTNGFRFSNIQVKDRRGNAISEYAVVVVDGERTNVNESVICTTDGTGWRLLVNIPSGRAPEGSPQIAGLDTATVSITGTSNAEANAPVVATDNPTSIEVNIGSGSGKQGFAIGFVVTSVTLFKDIVKRVNAADQFVLKILGDKANQATTTGTMEGLQAEVAQVYLNNGAVFTIDEALANNRVGGLADYRQSVVAVNLAEGGSSPPVGALPINNTVIWGDMIQYTIVNRPDTSDVWIEKSTPFQSRNAGEVVTFVIIIGNDGPDDALDVEIVDAVDADLTECMYLRTGDTIWRDWNGTLAVGTLPVGEKEVYYLRGRIASGSGLTSLNNTASIRTVNYDPNLTNNESTSTVEITRSADISITKEADKVQTTRASWLTYWLTVTNQGPSDIDDIIVEDTIPSELEQVQYSLDDGVSWYQWIGTYRILRLRNGESLRIHIKGLVKL